MSGPRALRAMMLSCAMILQLCSCECVRSFQRAAVVLYLAATCEEIVLFNKIP